MIPQVLSAMARELVRGLADTATEMAGAARLELGLAESDVEPALGKEPDLDFAMFGIPPALAALLAGARRTEPPVEQPVAAPGRHWSLLVGGELEDGDLAMLHGREVQVVQHRPFVGDAHCGGDGVHLHLRDEAANEDFVMSLLLETPLLAVPQIPDSPSGVES